MASAEDDDIAARFAAIVSPIAPSMDWDSEFEDDSRLLADQAAAAQRDQQERRDQEERAARREQRRLARARELAEYNAEKTQLEAEYNSDDDHFTPPEPPPLPALRPTTIGAVLLIVGGVALIGVPGLLVIDPQVTMVLGLLMIAGGALLLLSRLRDGDDDLNGSGNGAVL